VLDMMPAAEGIPAARPNGLLPAAEPEESMGELFPEGEVERGWAGGREEYPGGKYSDLAVDIINYLSGLMRQRHGVSQADEELRNMWFITIRYRARWAKLDDRDGAEKARVVRRKPPVDICLYKKLGQPGSAELSLEQDSQEGESLRFEPFCDR
jgi:hypothetical protein